MTSAPAPSGGAAPSEWPGQRLGLRPSGHGSIARPGRRIAALMIDFALCYVIYFAFFFGNDWASLLLFMGEQIVLLALLGGGVGHLLMGLRLVRVDGSWAGWWRPVLRTVLLVVIIPAVIWDSDQRGLHDVFAGTMLIRR
jgi:uncharacterized RDD family membrane protein YckC